MTIERLREVHLAQPFRPFTLHMADGKKIRISHPETLAYNPTGRTIFIALADDSLHHIDLLLVVRIEISNGVVRRKGRR